MKKFLLVAVVAISMVGLASNASAHTRYRGHRHTVVRAVHRSYGGGYYGSPYYSRGYYASYPYAYGSPYSYYGGSPYYGGYYPGGVGFGVSGISIGFGGGHRHYSHHGRHWR